MPTYVPELVDIYCEPIGTARTSKSTTVVTQRILLAGGGTYSFINIPANYTKDLDETISVTDALLLERPYAYVTNSVRTSVSTLLRLRRKPVRYVMFEVPPAFSNIQPGQTIWTAHELMPEAPTGTGRYDTWRLIPLFVVEVYDPLSPAKIAVKCVDLREIYASWWSPLLTNIGMTDDLNGIAILDRAGGWQTVRDQVGYGVRPPGDDAWQEVLANNPIVDTFGLRCEGGGDTNHLLNSTFSEGSGNVFTSWTKTTSGAAIAVEWLLYTLIDATGFRRATQLATYAAGEASYFSQTVNSLENKQFVVKVYYKDGGADDRMGLRISRSDTGEYWRDSDGTWQGSTQTISLTPGSGVIDTARFVTKLFDTTAGGAVNITVAVGHFSAASSLPQISQIQGVELLEVVSRYHGFRSPLPTKAGAVTRVVNYTSIVNDSPVRVLSPTRGFMKCQITPGWSHTDLADADVKYIWSSDFDGVTALERLRCHYSRTSATVGQYDLRVGPTLSGFIASVVVSGTDLPVEGETYTIICRWTSEDLDEYGLGGQALDLWFGNTAGVFTHGTFSGATTLIPDAECDVYLGTTIDPAELLARPDLMLDGHISNITIGDHCPSELVLLSL
jgi:hypothetical protein